MCFGDTKTKTENQTNTPDPAVQDATRSNLGIVGGLQSAGFTPYGGRQVADFSPMQANSFNMANQIAGDPDYMAQARALIGQYSGGPAGNVQTRSISEGIPQYMSAYTDASLAPQLRMQQQGFDAQNNDFNRSATMSGAFGDDRAGIGRGALAEGQSAQRSGLIGQAYNQAFNTAIGASAQDVANKTNVDTANAGLRENALARALGGAGALQNLQNQQLGVSGIVNQLGGQQTAQSQADLTAKFNQWLMSQQQPRQDVQLMNQTIAAGTKGLPSTSVKETYQPDNSGLGLLGSLGGAAAGSSGFWQYGLPLLMASDVRLKEDIEAAGKLFDGTNVYSYRYKGDPTPRIGLMAQEVEKTNPDAVAEVGGFKAVNYEKATRPSRNLARAFALAA